MHPQHCSWWKIFVRKEMSENNMCCSNVALRMCTLWLWKELFSWKEAMEYNNTKKIAEREAYTKYGNRKHLERNQVENWKKTKTTTSTTIFQATWQSCRFLFEKKIK